MDDFSLPLVILIELAGEAETSKNKQEIFKQCLIFIFLITTIIKLHFWQLAINRCLFLFASLEVVMTCMA